MSSSVNQNDMNVQTMENLTPLQQMYKVLTFHETRLHNIESKINELQKTLISVDEQLTQGKKNKQVNLEITE